MWSRVKNLFKSESDQPNATRQDLLINSDVFCMAPWVHLHAQPNGKAYQCCMLPYNDEFALADFTKNPDIKSAWNSDKLKRIRKRMLAGKRNDCCRNCYEYEKIGKFSERKQFNSDFEHHFPEVKKTKSDGSLTNTLIPYLDIRFANICNYKCRICNAAASSLWRNEEIKLGRLSEYFPKEIRVTKDDEAFWKSYSSLLPGLEKIHFAGGEPLYMEEHYKTLEQLIKLGKTDVTLSYNTNFSTLRYRDYNVFDLWNKFSSVHVFASLDDMGPRGDYQRKGQKWETIEQNIRSLYSQCPHVNFTIDSTVSIFNVLYIPEFYNYLIKNGLIKPGRMSLYLLFDPNYFSIRNLPQKAKKQIELVYNNFIQQLASSPETANICQHARSVIKHMFGEDYQLQNEFETEIKKVDELRGENFKEVFSEITQLLN